jgi:hypothetical protein
LSRYGISPTPSEDEAAAIVAVMDSLYQEPVFVAVASRWKMSGRDYGSGSTPLALRARYAHHDIEEDPRR